MTGVVTLISDPRVVGIPIADCGEPLVDLRDGASGEGLQLDARKQDEAGIWLNVREESGGACFTAAPGLTAEAATNRALLRRLMEGAAHALLLARLSWPRLPGRARTSRLVARW